MSIDKFNLHKDHFSRRHVTFSDQSESGYSTTTPTDEGSLEKIMSVDERKQALKKIPGIQQELDVNQNFSSGQILHHDTNPDLTGIDKFYQSHYKPKPLHPSHPSMGVSFTPPGSSPVYYDPLHLRNVGGDFSVGDQGSGFDLDRSDLYPYQVRGILKKSSLNSDHDLSRSIEEPVSSNKAKSIDISLDSVVGNTDTVVQVPPFNSNEGSPLLSSLQDPNHVSAFTPVTSRRKLPQSSGDFALQDFSPVKGPAVLDFVTSSSSPGSRHQDVLEPETGHLHYQHNPSLKKRTTSKEVYEDHPARFTDSHYQSSTFPHFYGTPPQQATLPHSSRQHSTPPSHHSTPSRHHIRSHQYSTPHHHQPGLPHQYAHRLQSTPPHHNHPEPSSQQSTSTHHHTKVSHQYSNLHHQQIILPHLQSQIPHQPHHSTAFQSSQAQSQPSRPVPAPRRSVQNLQQTFDSLNIHSESGSRASGSCSSGSPTSQVEALTNEAVRLRHFLDTASAKDLKRFLSDQLESKNPTMIKAMSKLIPVSVAKQIESHCVRCHKVSCLKIKVQFV